MRNLLTRPLWIWIALATACVGAVFMLLVAVISGVRYGVVWDFEPEHNAQIATFIGSIAGTLFSLTNAVLLFAALEAQRRANEITENHHNQDKRERNYDRLSARVQEIENRILSYKVTTIEVNGKGETIKVEHSGYDAWELAFQYWMNVSFPTSVRAGLLFEGGIDPEAYLHDQTFMLDTLVHLNYLIEDIGRSSMDSRDHSFLSKRAERLRNRLAKHKGRIREARDFLRETIDKGIEGVPKRDYVSPLLHVIRQMNEALSLLPDVPYRYLSPFEQVTIALDVSQGSVVLTALEVPTLQIDRITFTTTDKDWNLRLVGRSIKMEMESVGPNNSRLYYESRLLSLGVLFFENQPQVPEFDTKGRWSMEGRINEWVGNQSVEQAWHIRISIPGLSFGQSEAASLILYTNATLDKGASFQGVNWT